MVNKVILTGNVGKEPEIRHTSGGKSVASFTLASSEYWKDQSGARKKATEWHNIVVWGGLVEVVKKYVEKGSKLYVEGKLATRKWTDDKGVQHYMTEIIVSHDGKIEVFSRKEDDSGYQDGHYEDDEIPY